MFAGLRSRLLLPVALAVIPGIALLAFALRAEETRARVEVGAEAEQLAQLVAEQQARTADQAAGLLAALAQTEGVLAEAGAAGCSETLAAIARQLPDLGVVSVAVPDGRLRCASVPVRGQLDISDRAHFQRALARRAFAVGEYLVSPITGRGALYFAQPALGDDGRVRAVVVAGLLVARIQERLDAASLPPGSVLVVTDAAGRVLASRPREPVGRLWDAPLRTALLAAAAGPVAPALAPAAPGGREARAWAFAPAVAHGEVAMRVAVGVPTGALATGHPALRRSLLAFGLLSLLALAAALAMAEFLVVRRLDRLARAARRLSAGDLDARVGPSGAGELGQVARAFDEMAGSLQALTRQNRLILDSAGEGILGLDRDDRITFANATATRELGLPEAALRGRPLPEVLHRRRDPSAPEVSVSLSLRRDEPQHFEAVLEQGDGRRLPVDCVATPIHDGPAVVGSVVAFRDVSDRQRLEVQLREAQKMEAVGQLSAGVAHEINNPLAYIASNVDYALEQLAASAVPLPEVARALEDAREGAGRVRAIVRDLKMFSRQDDEAAGVAHVGQVIRSAANVAHSELKHRARLTLDLPEVPPVRGSPQRLGQVFLNLLVNAAQALPEGRPEEHEVRAACRTAEDGRVVVEVSDTGQGIPPEVLPRIFEPFFTTKPVGVGTGLGLSVCHGIVTALGGTIEVTSSPDRGTTFRVTLRPAEGPAEPAPSRPAVCALAARRGRVLVVDDEAPVLLAIQRVLGDAHEVVAFESAEAALAHLRADPGFDVVLCDVMMPGMDGVELYERVGRETPARARFAFMTGGAFTPRARAFLEKVPAPCLEKPIPPEGLRATIQRLMGEA